MFRGRIERSFKKMGQREIMTGGGCTVVTFRPQVSNYESFTKILLFCQKNNVSFGSLINSLIPRIEKCLSEKTSDDEPLTTNFDMGDVDLRQKSFARIANL